MAELVLLLPRDDGGAQVSRPGLLIAAGFFGASMAVAVFDCSKAGRQSRRSWGRSRRAKAYVAMLWIEVVTGVTIAVCMWLFLKGTIRPSVGFLVGIRKCGGLAVG
jgi:hypothetical protein